MHVDISTLCRATGYPTPLREVLRAYTPANVHSFAFVFTAQQHLLLDGFAKAADGGADGDGGGGVEGVRTARLGLVAAGAVPDAHSRALHGVLAAEVAEKFGVLRHLLLLHHLAEGSTVTGPVLSDDPCKTTTGWSRRREGEREER